MCFNQFIQQANAFGKKRTPFFFLIDFEKKKPIIWPLSQAAEQGIYFTFPGQANVDWQVNLPSQPFSLTKIPISPEIYRRKFAYVQRELQDGNTYLLNLTYPTEIRTDYDLQQIFQYSRAPYKLLYKNEFVCFSPECFVRTQGNKIYTYPMKGTIDATLENAEKQLLDSKKEESEHYTVVDLMRNDLAIVAERINVSRFRYVERVETECGAIFQTSSEIYGHLATSWRESIGSILSVLLPAGSVSGAPKEKTVHIIQQVERQVRGYYTGVFGIFDGDSLHSAVAIRFIERCGDKLYFRSGGGITAQSRLKDEYCELLQKVYVPSEK